MMTGPAKTQMTLLESMREVQALALSARLRPSSGVLQAKPWHRSRGATRSICR